MDVDHAVALPNYSSGQGTRVTVATSDGRRLAQDCLNLVAVLSGLLPYRWCLRGVDVCLVARQVFAIATGTRLFFAKPSVVYALPRGVRKQKGISSFPMIPRLPSKLRRFNNSADTVCTQGQRRAPETTDNPGRKLDVVSPKSASINSVISAIALEEEIEETDLDHEHALIMVTRGIRNRARAGSPLQGGFIHGEPDARRSQAVLRGQMVEHYCCQTGFARCSRLVSTRPSTRN